MAAALVLLAAPVRAANWYVSTTGTNPALCATAPNDGVGLNDPPYLTIQKAVDCASSGDVIHVAAGTYTEQVHVNGKNLTIQGAGKLATTIISPVTLTQFYTTPGPNNNYPIVFIENAADVRVRDLTIDGAGRGNGNYRFQGIAWWNAGGKLLDSDVKNIRETPFSGTQHGVSVYANNSGGGPYSLEIGNASLTEFQKNGTVFAGSALTVNMHDCTVTGAGSTAVIAQNAVQVSGATGTFTNCAVSNSFYSPATVTSTGLLAIGAGTVNVSGSSLTNCQSAAYYLETNGSISGTSVSGSLGWFGVILENDQPSLLQAAGRTSSGHPVVSAMDVDGSPSGVGLNATTATLYSLSISNGCLTGPGTTNTYGVDVYSGGGGVSCTMTNMEVTSWGYGVLVENPGATMNANHDAIVGNLTAGYDGTTGAGSQLAELNWWGTAGGAGVGGANPALGVDSNPWLISGADANPGCGFSPGPDNVVTPGPAPSCISIANACITIPVNISRTTADMVRGFSVNVQLSANLLLCSGPSSITEGNYLSSSNFGTLTNFQVIDNGGGSYTVDGAILGLPCGATAVSGNLFNVAVKKAPGPDGTGTITVSNVLLRDCSNVAVPASSGAPLSITIDTTSPAPITDLAAAQVLSGNGAVSTTGIRLTWATGGAGTVSLYRAPFGAYPEYDDDGPVSPPSPGAAPGAPWALVSASATSPYVDAAASRGFWYYVAFVKDACDNVSTVSNMTGGTLNYLLGDVTPAPGAGDNKVDGLDISLLGFNYGLTGEGAVDAVGYLDVGPTLTGAANARPKPDDKLNFEDLIIYAINYGPSGLQVPQSSRTVARFEGMPSGTDALTLEAPGRVQVGERFTVSLRLKGAGDLQGLSTQLSWDASVAEPEAVEASSWLSGQNGLALSAAPGNVDVALLGARDLGFSGDGVLATVTFLARAAGEPRVAIARADARDLTNRKVDLAAQHPLVPTTTAFAPVAPNPFEGSTNLSFSLAQAGEVELAIYSVDGRKVKTLARGPHEAAVYRLEWNGTDDGGRAVRAGLYFARLTTAAGRFTRRLTLVK